MTSPVAWKQGEGNLLDLAVKAAAVRASLGDNIRCLRESCRTL